MAKDKNNKNIEGGRKWMTENAAATYLGLNKRTLQRWRQNNGVIRSDGSVKPGPKFYKPAGQIFYDRDELDAWIVGNAR